jgi:hypothetical protein
MASGQLHNQPTDVQMTLLEKLNFQAVSRQIERDPVTERRARFRAGVPSSGWCWRRWQMVKPIRI